MRTCDYCRRPARLDNGAGLLLPLHGETLGDCCATSRDAPLVCDSCARKRNKINPWWPRPHPDREAETAGILLMLYEYREHQASLSRK